MEFPEASRSIRQIDSTPTKEDDMEYHALPEVTRSENCQILILWKQDHEQSQP